MRVAAVIEAVASSDSQAAAMALRGLIDAGKAQLDHASLAELVELANETGRVNQQS